MSHHRFSLRRALLPTAMIAAAACQPSAAVRARLATADSISMQKDSLLQEVALQARVLSDVSAEIATVRVENLQVTSESPRAAQHDSMVQKVRYIVTRLTDTEQRLRGSQQRVRSLSRLSDSLRTTLEATITNLQDVIESQKLMVASLTAQLDTLQLQNRALGAENLALKDTVAAETMVYYVIGTKEELKRKGLITEEGGSRVLFILWRTGETVTPARDFDEAYFAAIDRRTTTEIPLPSPQGRYRIVSRHDFTLLATPHDERGRVQGAESLRISNSAEFWRPSKFLIILQEEPGAPVQGTDD
jgi:uncharacterized protein YeeX (DUF496 family)